MDQPEEVQIDRLCLRVDSSSVAEASPTAVATPIPRRVTSCMAPPAKGPAAGYLADFRVAAGVRHFFEWCVLREEGQEARRAGQPPPWCTHPLMARSHFCNVSRLDDRGTAAFHAFVRQQHVHSLAGVLWCSLVYRRLNRLSTFADWQGRLPLPHEAAAFLDWLSRRVGDPEAPSVFTNKHQQSGGLQGYVQMVRGLAGLDAPPAPGFPHALSLARALEACSSAAEAHATLKGHMRHVGQFIAWQVLCDVVESGHLPQAARDDWVALGPGAKSGLNLIFGQASSASVGEAAARGIDETMVRLRALQAAQPWAMRCLGRETVGIVSADDSQPPLLLRDLEHSLCEFSKWFALRRGWCSPGAYDATQHGNRNPLPLLPRLRVERLRGGAFRVVAPEGEGGQGTTDDCPVCRAFPPAGYSTDVREPPPLPPWLPRASMPCSRKRAHHDGTCNATRKQGSKPERAALMVWFDAFWPSAMAAGWRVMTKLRHAGATAGTADSYWLSPAGRRFRSRAEVAASQGFTGGEAAPDDAERVDALTA